MDTETLRIFLIRDIMALSDNQIAQILNRLSNPSGNA